MKTFRFIAAGLAAGVLGVALAFPAPANPTAPVPDSVPVGLLTDLSTGQILFAREADRRFVPASVTKVMTAYTAFRLFDEGRISSERRVQIGERLEEEWSGTGSSMFLKAGEQPTYGQLLLGITTVSGNDAAVAFAIASTGSLENWLALMNEYAADLGMDDTHFGSPNGYPDEGHTFTTAEDLAILAEAITTRYPTLYDRYFGNHGMTWGGITQENHDPLIGEVEGADGMKTGFTNEAGYTFLGSGERDGRRLVLVVGGAPSWQLRDKMARDLLEWGFEAFERRTLLTAGTMVGNALVQDGAVDRVALRTPNDVLVALQDGDTAGIAAEMLYHGPLRAPIAEGDHVARLRVTIEGQEPLLLPLEAAETVAQANAWQRLVNGLYGLFA